MNTDDDDFDKKWAEFFRRRKRGRPPMGYAKALDYSNQVDALMRSGMSPWRAVVKVAELNRKRPEHISSCRKMVADTDPREYDPEDDFSPETPAAGSSPEPSAVRSVCHSATPTLGTTVSQLGDDESASKEHGETDHQEPM